MYASNAHVIRRATEADAESLNRLADLTSQPPLEGRVLIAQIDGTTVAAVSVDDRRSLSDPGCFIGYLLPCLRARAEALIAYEAEPSLSVRIAAAVPQSYRPQATQRTEHAVKRGTTRRATGTDHGRPRVRTASMAGSGALAPPTRW